MRRCDVIIEKTGNLLEDDADALVNTVNTVGVMGKGIALQFKRSYPDMFRDYARAARAGEVVRGHMHIWPTGALNGPKYIINFPTKGHWRSPSHLSDIESGLVDLVEVIRQLGIRSIAIPPLGAGSGGLDWRAVEPLIRSALGALADVDVHLYAPQGSPSASTIRHSTTKPKMTAGRAALVSILDQYARSAVTASPIEVQKLMYFLQEAGEPLRLNFVGHTYGPYADNLRHVLIDVEGHYLTGYGDGSARALEAEPIRVLPGAEEEAGKLLAAQPGTQARVRRVLQLAEGFESMYGLELLSTVHWVATHEPQGPPSQERVVELVQQWSPRKRGLFTERHISIALDTLRAKGWIAA